MSRIKPFFMKNILLLLLLLVVISCTNQSSQKENSTVYPKTTNQNCEREFLREWRKETLHIDEIKINDISFSEYTITIDTLIHLLGQPDKIYDNNASIDMGLNCFVEENTNYWVYGNTVFEEYQGKCILRHLDFNSTKKIQLQSPNLTFEKNLQLKEVITFFPKSFKRVQVSGNMWTGTMQIYGSPSGDMGRWLLKFHGERLEKMTYLCPY
jgi:hypothetical protein